MGLTSCPGPLGPVSEGLQVQLALPGQSLSVKMARGFDQLSLVTGARVRIPLVFTSCPG